MFLRFDGRARRSHLVAFFVSGFKVPVVQASGCCWFPTLKTPTLSELKKPVIYLCVSSLKCGPLDISTYLFFSKWSLVILSNAQTDQQPSDPIPSRKSLLSASLVRRTVDPSVRAKLSWQEVWTHPSSSDLINK